jgi:hypothetical protein
MMKARTVSRLPLALLLAAAPAPAVTLTTSYVGTVFGVPDRYDYAPCLMRNSRSSPSLVRCWFGGEEWGNLLRVKAGGTPYVDPSGRVWADRGFSGGETYGTTRPIAGTSTPELYQTCRAGAFQYTFSGLAPGSYVITLKFAEIVYTHEGERVFDVLVNGGAAGSRDGLDVVAAAGGPDRAFDLQFWAFNTTSITVAFNPRVGEPMISAIEIAMPFLDTIKYAESSSFPGEWSGGSVVLCPSEGGADLFEAPDYPLCRSDFPTGEDRDLVNDPSVVFVDGQYLMYYTAPQVTVPTPGTCNQIFLARSADGRTWTKDPESSRPPRPVIPYSGLCDGTDPFEYGVGEASVVYKDSRFWLYYYYSPGPNQWMEMLSTSTDGVSFTPGVSVLPADSTLGLVGGDVKWIPGWNLWLLVGSVRTYPHLFPDANTKGVMRWNISLDGVHWLPHSFRGADREFRTAKYQNMAPGLLGDELGWIGDGRPSAIRTVPVVYGAGTVDARTWDLDAMELTFSVEPLYGNLDEITPDLQARGWAYDPDTGTNDAAASGSPAAPLGFGSWVRAVATNVRTGRSIASAWEPAELPRSDLVTAGVAPDRYHGFLIDLNRFLPRGTWRVRVQGREFPTPGETFIASERIVTIRRREPRGPDVAPSRTRGVSTEVRR